MSVGRIVEAEHGTLRGVVQVNGRARTAVIIYPTTGEGGEPLHTDRLDTASAKARAAFVSELASRGADEADATALLARLAEEAVAASVPSDAPAAAETLDPEPWPDPVDGAELLGAIAAHVRRYVHVPNESADAASGWGVLTHCVEWLTFAPLLVLASATKRSGKTLLLSLLGSIVRRGRLTSPTSITSAVLFRLNEKIRPVLLLDEAERLQSRHAAPELVELINNGYRKGAKAYRCVESNGTFDVEAFDAFGFRALALIGKPSDTLADRALIIPMERKARAVKVARFHETRVEREGHELARKIRRWTTEAQAELQAAHDVAPRPLWLGDRDCDNWAGLFALASVAGGDWPARMEAAARHLAGARDDDGDVGERLLHDTRATFAALEGPPVIPSGELLQRLNAIETSGWGDVRDGRGLSTHSLAARFKPFGIKPRAARHPDSGAMVRGYWLADFADAFARYPAPDRGGGNTETLETIGAGKSPPSLSETGESGSPGTAISDSAPSGRLLDSEKKEGAPSPAQTVSTVSAFQADPDAAAFSPEVLAHLAATRGHR